MERLEVELPVCPVCKHVGKLPKHGQRYDWCTGRAGADHKGEKMIAVKFRSVDPA